MSSHFFRLPVEIRNQIYGELLHVQRAKVLLDGGPTRGHSKYAFSLAVLRTNRQIYHESSMIFQENKFVRIMVSWQAFEEDIIVATKFPVIARGQKAKSFNNWYLSAALWFFGEPSKNLKWVFISCLKDLPDLCKNLFYHGTTTEGFNEMLQVRLDIQDPSALDKRGPTEATQRSLLLPFAIMKDLHGLETGLNGIKPSDAVEKELRSQLRKPNPTVAEYLQRATELKIEGNELLRAGHYARSLQAYIDAYAAMHINVIGRRFQILLDGYYGESNPIVGGIYDGQRGDLVRHRLGSVLNWNIVQAYLKLRDWEQAYIWGERAISEFEYNNTQQAIMDDTPPATTEFERAKGYYRMALACRGQEKYDEADRNLLKARIYAPRDKLIEQEQQDIIRILKEQGEESASQRGVEMYRSWLGR